MGEFNAEDKILCVLGSGVYKLISPDLATHFDENIVILEKWITEKPLTAVYYDGEKDQWFVKRFLIEASKGPVTFISEHPKSKLGIASLLHHPVVYVRFDKRNKLAKNKMDESIDLREFIAVKGLKAIGNRLTAYPVLNIELLDADPQREIEAENMLQELIAARQPEKIEIDRNEELFDLEETIRQNPDDIDFEIEGLEEEMARFKEQRKSGAIPDPPKPEKKPRSKPEPPGEQASLF